MFRSLTDLPTRVAQLVKIIEDQSIRQHPNYFTWDQLAAACVIDPAVICKTISTSASVELHRSDCRGQMTVDMNKAWGKTDNVSIVTVINRPLYEKLITAAFMLL